MAHIGGLSVVTRALHTANTLTVLPRFEPEAVTEAARKGASLASLVSTALSRIDAGMFRKILLGGAPAPEQPPANVITTYGMTESGSGVVYDGFPLAGVEVRTNASGLIQLRSSTLLRCYRDGSNPIDDHGWFTTDDAGEIDGDGRLTVLGRASDVIITGGEKVWPQQVERILDLMPEVAGALVYGKPDPEWGERVVAALELKPGCIPPSLQTVREATKQKLPAYCAPREVRIVEQLDRTVGGKLRRERPRSPTSMR